MKCRALTIEDIVKVKELHEKYFGEFNFPDFSRNFLCAFAVTDDKDEIILAGGVRDIAETILVTDKSKNIHAIGQALLEALEISRYTCKKFNIELLHAFVKDGYYQKHLERHGFSPRCQALSMQVSNG